MLCLILKEIPYCHFKGCMPKGTDGTVLSACGWRHQASWTEWRLLLLVNYSTKEKYSTYSSGVPFSVNCQRRVFILVLIPDSYFKSG